MSTRVFAFAASTILSVTAATNAAVIFSDNYTTTADPWGDHPKWVSTAANSVGPYGAAPKGVVSGLAGTTQAIMWPVQNAPNTLTLATQQINNDNSAPGVAFPSGGGQKLIVGWNTYYSTGPINVLVNLTSNGDRAAGGNGITVERHIASAFATEDSLISLNNGNSTFASANPEFVHFNDQRGAGVFRLEVDSTTATLFGRLAQTEDFNEVLTLKALDPAALGAADIMMSGAHGIGAIGNVMLGLAVSSYAADGDGPGNDYLYWSRGASLEQVIPEPASVTLLSGGLLLGSRRRR